MANHTADKYIETLMESVYQGGDLVSGKSLSHEG